jgi:heat shock protein HspQ
MGCEQVLPPVTGSHALARTHQCWTRVQKTLASALAVAYFPIVMSSTRAAKYKIGQVLRHRIFPFRGVVFDIDPVFNNTEEWYQSIPAEVRPHKDQPFYHLFAENSETEYIAYVSEQNLLPDTTGEPVRHPQVSEIFVRDEEGSYRPRNNLMH